MKKLVMILAIAISTFACRNTGETAGTYPDTKDGAIDSMKVVMDEQKAELAKQKTIDSMRVIAAQQEKAQPVIINNTTPAANTTTTTTTQKKGWSGAAKGAVIGAGVGAIGGAVINKKDPATGAVIGGLAGAGVGAGTGAILDSEKKKKEAAAINKPLTFIKPQIHELKSEFVAFIIKTTADYFVSSTCRSRVADIASKP